MKKRKAAQVKYSGSGVVTSQNGAQHDGYGIRAGKQPQVVRVGKVRQESFYLIPRRVGSAWLFDYAPDDVTALIRGGSGLIVGTCNLTDVVGPLTRKEFLRNRGKAGLSKAEARFAAIPRNVCLGAEKCSEIQPAQAV